MRHRKHKNSISRTSSPRKALENNLVMALIKHNRIRTTLKKAKITSQLADKLVTLAKRKSIHAQRQLFAYLKSRKLVKYMVEELAPRFEERRGGYTRILKHKSRPGDGALMAIIELTEMPAIQEKKQKKKKTKAKDKDKDKDKERDTSEVKKADVKSDKDETDSPEKETKKKSGFFTNLRKNLGK